MKNGKDKVIQLLANPVQEDLPESNQGIVMVMRLRRFARSAILNTIMIEEKNSDLKQYLEEKHIKEEKSIRDITDELNSDIGNLLEEEKIRLDKIILEVRNEMINLFNNLPGVNETRIDSALYGSKRTKPGAQFNFLIEKYKYSITEIHRNAVTRIMDELDINRRDYSERHTSSYNKKRESHSEGYLLNLKKNIKSGNYYVNKETLEGYIIVNGKQLRISASEALTLLIIKKYDLSSIKKIHAKYLELSDKYIKNGVLSKKLNPDSMSSVISKVKKHIISCTTRPKNNHLRNKRKQLS